MLTTLLSPPDVGAAERDAVVRALESGWVAPVGPDLTAFEDEVAARVGVARAVALTSGTAALHLALVSWGIGPGDVVLLPSLTFAATVNAVRYVGATPHLVDSRPDDGNISPELLACAAARVRAEGGRVRVVLPVDLLGRCADLDAVGAVAEAAGARVLCDAAESFGASYGGRAAGSFGDASVVSFNGNKVMTTSGGGMLLTDDHRLADHAHKLATQAREPVAHYEHTEVGYNYRLSNLLAAVGRAQLGRLDEMIARRRGWRAAYRDVVASHPGVRVLGDTDGDDAGDNCWLTAVVVDPAASGTTAGRLAAAMTAADIETRPLWKPMHLQPVHAACPATLDGTSARLHEQGLTLPSGSAMTAEQGERVLDVLAGELAGALR